MGERAVTRPVAAISPVQQMLASGSGALITSGFVTPLDVVKIRLQAQQTSLCQALSCDSATWGSVIRPSKWKSFLFCKREVDNFFACCNRTKCNKWHRTPTYYSGTVDAFVKIARHEGLKSLWSGLEPTLVMAVPATIIYFTCYDQLRDFMRYSLGFQGSHIPLVAGALARLGAVTVISPLELVRTKMQSRRLSYRELQMCVRSAVAQNGLLSLWRGWGPTVLRDVPFSALYWFNYELIKAQLCEQSRTSQANFPISFTAGALSGAVAATVTLPFDVVKTQRQIQLGETDPLQVPVKKTTSTWNIMKQICADCGYRGLFAGFLPRLIKVAPACAVMISTYELGKNFFQELNLHRNKEDCML
ncbi:solute carrier family 25 member 39 [Thalassophryne amazonica]|uniref:solute carrier family 25 member 39 n=1 Tax=Thalassophryne amazonica TaxID=390379 RepID=UPI0014721BD2|nr:solute carrier family 25 member 39 [Thalassophryne amazonica]